MARTYSGEYRPSGSGTWLPLFSGASSPFYDWAWAGAVPPGQYYVRVNAADDGDVGPWSEQVLFTFAVGAGAFAVGQIHVLCGDVYVVATADDSVITSIQATRFRFYAAGTATLVHQTGEATDPETFLMGAAVGVLAISTTYEVTFEAKVNGAWLGESGRYGFTTRNCVAAPPRSYQLAHLELWTDVKAAGGYRIAVTRNVLAASERLSLSPAEERASVDLPLHAAFARAVTEMQVLRPVFVGGEWSEWRIVKATEERDERNELFLRVELESIRYDLADGVATRVLEDGSVQHQWEEQVSLTQHIARALKDARTYFTQGLVIDDGRPSYPGAPTTSTPIWFAHHGTPLEQLTRLAEQEEMEIEVTRREHDGLYLVQLVTERGASVPPVRLAHQRNLYALQRTRDAGGLVTVVYPFGPEREGARQGMEGAQWEVVAVNTVTAGAHRIQLADGPIEFDDQFGGSPHVPGKFLELAGPTTRKQILDTIRETQEVVVADAGDIVEGSLVMFRLNAFGQALTFLERPDAIGAFGVVRAPVHFDDIPPVDNLVGNAFGTILGTEGMPAGFGKIGAPSVTASASPLYTRYGGRSWRVAAADGEGLTSAWYPIAATDRRPYVSSAGKVWVFEGTVRQTTRFRDAAGTISEKEVTTGTLVNQWTDGDKGLYDAGMNIYDWPGLGLTGPVVEFQVRYTAAGAAATFMWDAVLVCQDPAPPEEFYDGLASNALHRLGNKHLREWGWQRFTYDVTPRDLQRLRPDVYLWERFVLGAPAEVYDPDIEPGARVRIAEINHDWLTPDGTAMRLDTRPVTLADVTISRTSLPRRTGRSAGVVEGETPPEPGTEGAISNVRADHVAMGIIRLSWDHTSAVETAAAGLYTVRITREDSVFGPHPETAARNPKLEHDGTSTVANAGSYDASYPTCEANTDCQPVTRSYTVELLKDGLLVSMGTTSKTVSMGVPPFV